MKPEFVSVRPPPDKRSFRSEAVEAALAETRARIGSPELAWLFENCLPNTLDTTVTFDPDFEGSGVPDTFVITGDIDAMWLRDSTNQVWPYLRWIASDAPLRALVHGLIRRQAACVRLDPYANAFFRDGSRESEWKHDLTEMRPGVHERKYELDSLCAFLRLSAGYERACGDRTPFDAAWLEAVRLTIETIRLEQAGMEAPDGPRSPYEFRRRALRPTENLAEKGRGAPARRCGLSRSPFRPSDDGTTFPYLVPANAMAVVELRATAGLFDRLGQSALGRSARLLADEIDAALRAHAVVLHPEHGAIWAYEVDGFGSCLLMDDANVPSLLSLPYLGYCETRDPLYRRTRAFVLSRSNPYFAEGAAGGGVGGPHVGLGWIWPMAIVMQALTSDSDEEIRGCLVQLMATHAGTGLMHETFWKDDPEKFTRPWFAWANTLFGELVLNLSEHRPHLLKGFA